MKKEIEKILIELIYEADYKHVAMATEEFTNKILSLFESKIDECKQDISKEIYYMQQADLIQADNIISIIKNKLR